MRFQSLFSLLIISLFLKPFVDQALSSVHVSLNLLFIFRFLVPFFLTSESPRCAMTVQYRLRFADLVSKKTVEKLTDHS